MYKYNPILHFSQKQMIKKMEMLIIKTKRLLIGPILIKNLHFLMFSLFLHQNLAVIPNFYPFIKFDF